MMKRLLSLLLALLIPVGMLCACARQPDQQTVPTEQDVSVQTTAATEPVSMEQVQYSVPGVAISEVMPDNRNLLLGHELDWVELYNAEDVAVSLDGCFLTDDPEGPQQKSLAGMVIPAGGYLAVTLEEANLLSELGGTLYLTCNGQTLSQLTYEAPKNGESFDETGICRWPTPGYANTQSGYLEYLESRALPELIINEVLTSNSKFYGVQDQYYDLIEVKNNSDQPLNLKDYYLTDKWESKNRYYFPDVTLEPGGFYVVICSGLSEKGVDHAPFGLGGGETVYLAHRGVFIDALVIPEDLQPNESFGRSGKLPVYLEKATFGKENSEGDLAGVAVPTADVLPGVYDEAVTVTLSGEGTIYYTLDGSRPTTRSLVYRGPIKITGVQTIRAFCAAGGRSSQITEFAYVVGEKHDLPIVTVAIPNRSLRDEKTGVLNHVEATYEYEGVITLFEDGQVKFSEPFGFRLHGNDSRKGAKQNFQVRFRAKYGASKLEYRLFEDRDITEFDSLLLKGGSEDWYRANMRDEVCTEIANGTTQLYTQATKPVVLYLGGAYWGVYYLRERFSDAYVASHMGVNPESVDILYSSAGAVQIGSGKDFQRLKSYTKSHDMTLNENYIYVTEQINVTSLMDWYILRTYLGDWDIANIRRARSDEGDNLWHWMFFDLDWSFIKHSFSNIYDNKGGDYTLIHAVLESEAGQDAFLKRYAHLMNTILNEGYINGVIDSIVSAIESEMPRDRQRWGVTMTRWENEVQKLRNFVKDEERTKKMLQDLKEYFSLNDEQMEYYFGDLVQLIK